MNKVNLSNVFKGNYLGYITKYKENIQSILNEYDVVIFMARKAICFFESMVLNGEIKKTNCEIFSSRIIDYNTINKLRNKKVAIVDDVVVKGTSLNRVINILDKEDIKAFILVVACESSFPQTLINTDNFIFCDSYVTFNLNEIYSFAGMITEYIEASMCPFNIDQPIYRILDIKKEQLEKLLFDYNAIDISSSLQQNYDIKNKVIFFRNVKKANSCALLNTLPDNTILKIRFMIQGTRVLAIPFVLFPSLTDTELNRFYSFFRSDSLDDYVTVDNSLIIQENKMKVISYFYSEILINVFLNTERIKSEKSIENDIFHYSVDSNSLYNLKNIGLNINDEASCIKNEPIYSYSKFTFSNAINLCYRSIIKTCVNETYTDSSKEPINEIIITHDQFKDEIEKDFEQADSLASCVIDVFIDRGMMVPTIAHFDNGIIRTYKMGEYSKLTKSQILVFAAMLFHYQECVGRDLGKTELEKLCVLFFQTAINRGVFPQQAQYEDDCYSICYSLFGPRVSLSNTVYNASTDSVLVTDFCEKKNGSSIIKCKNGQYTINPISAPNRMRNFIKGFSYPYIATSQMFEMTKTIDGNPEKLNMFVHTYVQYLTLRAIGNNKKNQYLSLCAELYQLSKLKDDFFNLNKKEKKECEWILKGINSGLWKYWCYKNDALDKTSNQIFEKRPNVGAYLFLDVESASDISKEWDVYIETIAHLLYKAAFLINEVLKSTDNLKYFNTGDEVTEIDADAPEKGTMFTIGAYYAEFKETRHFYEKNIRECALSDKESMKQWASNELIKLKIEARRQLDLCDQTLESVTLKYSTIRKLLIVYSVDGSFPINISDGLNELYFKGLDKTKNCKVYGLSNKKSNVSDLTDMLDRIKGYSNDYNLKFFVLDVGDGSEIKYIAKTVKDVRIANILNCVLEGFLQRQVSNLPELVLIGPKSYNLPFQRGNHQFTPVDKKEQNILENSIKELAYNQNTAPIFVNIYKIGKCILKIEGENSNNTVVFGNNTTIPEGTIDLLQEAIKQVNSIDREQINKAIVAAKENDTKGFLNTMKSCGKHALSIIENIASNVIYEWLHYNGIL